MVLVLNEQGLLNDKEVLVKNNILTEQLLESVLHSYNKHAKILRDKMYELKERNKLYLDHRYDNYSPVQIEKVIDDHYEKHSDDIDEYNKMDILKFDIYNKKDELLSRFLKPSMVHYSSYSNFYTYHFREYNIYEYYETANTSFHSPVEDYDEDNLVAVDVGFLHVSAAPENSILSLSYCDDIYNIIINKKDLVYEQSDYTKNMPDYMGEYNRIKEQIYNFWLEEYDKAIIKKMNDTNGYYADAFTFDVDTMDFLNPDEMHLTVHTNNSGIIKGVNIDDLKNLNTDSIKYITFYYPNHNNNWMGKNNSYYSLDEVRKLIEQSDAYFNNGDIAIIGDYDYLEVFDEARSEIDTDSIFNKAVKLLNYDTNIYDTKWLEEYIYATIYSWADDDFHQDIYNDYQVPEYFYANYVDFIDVLPYEKSMAFIQSFKEIDDAVLEKIELPPEPVKINKAKLRKKKNATKSIAPSGYHIKSNKTIKPCYCYSNLNVCTAKYGHTDSLADAYKILDGIKK